MKSFIRFFLFLNCFCIVALAQNQPNVIFWSEKPECGSKRLENKPNFTCSQFMEHGQQVRVIKNNDISLYVKFFNDNIDLKTYLVIENHTDNNISLNADSWIMHQYKNQKDFYAGGSPLFSSKSKTDENMKLSKTGLILRSSGSSTNQTPNVQRALTNARTDQDTNPVTRYLMPTDVRTIEGASSGGSMSFGRPYQRSRKKNKVDAEKETLFEQTMISNAIVNQNETLKGGLSI